MKAIMITYDTLAWRFLSPYGADGVHTPNFDRLAGRAVTFDRSFIGSFPTIPCRRELHTGRYNFLHRSWGPLEPFDDSMPEILKNNGVYTHFVCDCQHYWEDGGATYHHRYCSHEFHRGQEGDAWKGRVLDDTGRHFSEGAGIKRQDRVNRGYMAGEEQYPQFQTFARGIEFVRDNCQNDNWLCHIETFDPHQPFMVPKQYLDLYPHDWDGPLNDWPGGGKVEYSPEETRHIRCVYAALVSMCDAHLGKVLDLMDERFLWNDTMLIVNTDHGFLFGEHGFWNKGTGPFYNEVSRTPLFIWDPRSRKRGERRLSLVQAIDWAPTLLEFFGVDVPPDMMGRPLRDTVADDTPVHEAGLFGQHRELINVTDGRYVYMRGIAREDNQPLFDYTLMPTHMRERFSVDELQNVELAGPFSFTKGCKVLKIPVDSKADRWRPGTMLFDLHRDFDQNTPIEDRDVEERMIGHLVRLMQEADAPPEQYERMGLTDRL